MYFCLSFCVLALAMRGASPSSHHPRRMQDMWSRATPPVRAGSRAAQPSSIKPKFKSWLEDPWKQMLISVCFWEWMVIFHDQDSWFCTCPGSTLVSCDGSECPLSPPTAFRPALLRLRHHGKCGHLRPVRPPPSFLSAPVLGLNLVSTTSVRFHRNQSQSEGLN